MNKELYLNKRRELYLKNRESNLKYAKLYRERNKEKISILNKEYKLKNKIKLALYAKEYTKKWREKNKEKIKQNKKIEYILNRDKVKQRAKIFYEKNKLNPIFKSKHNERNKKRRKIDPNFRLQLCIRNWQNRFLKSPKNFSSSKLIGCSIEEFKKHLQKQFKEGMSWDNHGPKGWHIDHIIPLSKFDLTNDEEKLKACHFSNTQPLWWKENLSKGNKI